MSEQHIGVVRDLFCYPVKSMRGQRLNETRVDEMGLVGDRAYALREENDRIVSAKNRPLMLEFGAFYEDAQSQDLFSLKIRLPDGRTLNAYDSDASAVLSEALGRPVSLEPRPSGPVNVTEFDLDGKTIFGDVPVEQVLDGGTPENMPRTWHMLPGSYWDEFNVTLLATGTLTHLHHLAGGDVRFDPRRFRPNILIETEPGAVGFIEDSWLGGLVAVGPTIRVAQLKPNIRCVMTTHRQGDLAKDMRVIRTAVQHHKNFVGVGAIVKVAGTVRVGDAVTLQT